MRAFAWSVIAVFGLQFLVGCQDENTNIAANSGGVAVVDLDEIANRLGRDVEIAKAVEQREATYQQQLRELEDKFRQELESRRSQLAEQPTEDELRNLAAVKKNLDAKLTDAHVSARRELARYRQQLIGRLRDEIKPIARQAALERGFHVVVTKNDAVVFSVEPEAFITDAVVSRLTAQAGVGSGPQNAPPHVASQPQPNGAQR